MFDILKLDKKIRHLHQIDPFELPHRASIASITPSNIPSKTQAQYHKPHL